MQVVSIEAVPFSLPLIEPFRISRASVTATRAALVEVHVAAGGRAAVGLGEAALPLGSDRQPSDLVAEIHDVRAALHGAEIQGADDVASIVDAHFDGSPPARAALHGAIVDAWARLDGRPLCRVLGGGPPSAMTTDITLPIADPAHLAGLARGYAARGFSSFKIKVGADLAADREVVRLVAAATPGASLRFDANMGFTAHDAMALLAHAAELGMIVDCFEQPCGREDFDGLRRVREVGIPVVADESVATMEDLERLAAAGAVDGINLKLVKMGGIDRALAIGHRARALGMSLMVGAMIESRLGLTAMAHVAQALGGVEWVDLDTAFLLRSDPWEGGMAAEGATLTLPAAPGLGIHRRDVP